MLKTRAMRAPDAAHRQTKQQTAQQQPSNAARSTTTSTTSTPAAPATRPRIPLGLLKHIPIVGLLKHIPIALAKHLLVAVFAQCWFWPTLHSLAAICIVLCIGRLLEELPTRLPHPTVRLWNWCRGAAHLAYSVAVAGIVLAAARACVGGAGSGSGRDYAGDAAVAECLQCGDEWATVV
ncbi:hypothetical protein Slin15195_G129220 [Septoria linicola]|uniref:Uncharacterized protein n=1 Tax=Septoria linicola TaxID=215465 RepID=A0A9Q9B5Z2_9PEZI|nr:hypothetical protein Slin15195_G129220 [Septoria linicola]